MELENGLFFSFGEKSFLSLDVTINIQLASLFLIEGLKEHCDFISVAYEICKKAFGSGVPH